MKNNRLNIAIAACLILVAGVARIVNHEMHLYNFAPVCALGLFSGAIIKNRRLAFLLPILAQFIGDVYIALFTTWQGFYGIEQVCVYASLVLVTLMGIAMNEPKALKVLGYTLAGSLVFFLVSNLGVWLAIELGKVDLFNYGHGLTGLVNTYVAAIPFYKNTLAGEFTGSILLFGSYSLLKAALATRMQKVSA